jgi:sulfite oxidase
MHKTFNFLKNTIAKFPNSSKYGSKTFQLNGRVQPTLKYLTCFGIGLGSILYFTPSHLLASEDDLPPVGIKNPKLPTYTKEEIAKHKTKADRIWVTYKEGVYDITDFIPDHPGGEKILLAAGGAIDSFWKVFATHHQKHVYVILEKHRIGNYEKSKQEMIIDSKDPYASEPERNPSMRPNSTTPWVAEAPPEILAGNFITPNDFHYVRSHLPVPIVDPKTYRLTVQGLGGKTLTLSLEDLKKFPKHTVMATLQCMGNRRNEMKVVKDIHVVGENIAMISNANWSGARLSDVLKATGFTVKDISGGIRHVQFESIDMDPIGHPFGSSIPIQKAMDEFGDVILAYEMNGEDLPRDHGYPVRLLIPGHAGNKNVKWLKKINLSNKESDNWGFDFYREYPKDLVDISNKTYSPIPQIMPINSAILTPKNNVEVEEESTVDLQGWAFAGGGRGVHRVEISTNGGATWSQAELEQSDQPFGQRWAWTRWKTSIDVPKFDGKPVEVLCRAVDDQSNKQPAHMEDIWNVRGVNCNAYHKININVKKSE